MGEEFICPPPFYGPWFRLDSAPMPDVLDVERTPANVAYMMSNLVWETDPVYPHAQWTNIPPGTPDWLVEAANRVLREAVKRACDEVLL